MDEKLSGYMNSQIYKPPAISESKIINELGKREKRMSLVLLSLAGLLWTAALYILSFRVGIENHALGITMLCTISIGLMCSSLFAGITLKYKGVLIK